MSLRSDMQQNIQGELNFSATPAGETREAGREETESRLTTHAPERPAGTTRLMEEICDRENLKEALRRVKANKVSPGIDGITVNQLDNYLEQHWSAIREQLLSGTYKPKPVKRVEIPKPEAGVRKLCIPRTGPLHSASGDAGSAAAVGPNIFRSQLRFSTETIGASGSSAGTAVHCRRRHRGG